MTHLNKIYHITGSASQYLQAVMILHQMSQSSSLSEMDHYLLYAGIEDLPDLNHWAARNKVSIPTVHEYELKGQNGLDLSRLQYEIAHRLDEETKPVALVAYGTSVVSYCAAFIGAGMNIPVVHIEAGERCFNREEFSTELLGVLSDHCASLCLTATKRGAANLRREGIAPQRIRFAGDPLVDFFHTVNLIDYPLPFNTSAMESDFCLVVIYSDQNQTNLPDLLAIFTSLKEIQRPLVCIVDPKMMNELEKTSWKPSNRFNVHMVSSYGDYLALLLRCDRCLTNSADVMREAYLAHRLCLILDPNPWWPELMETGWAIPISTHGTSLSQAIDHVPLPDDGSNYLLGGKNISENIVQELTDFFSGVDSQTVSWSHHGPSHVLPKSDKTDLTFMNYRHQIHQFLAHDYLFVSFPEAPLLLNKQQRFVIMRHDIDFDLKRALFFAEMEAELGVKSTYFFLLRTDHYNVFSREGTDIVNRILGLGHDMGLHFDCAAYDEDTDERSLASACRFEALMLENWFKYPVSIVSYHRPNQQVMTGDAALSYPLLHTYMKIFTTDIQYYSDSRGQWQFGFPSASDAFMQGQPMHILVHPIWWHEQPVPPYQTLLSYVDAQAESLERSIARNCVVYRNGWLKEEI